MRDRRRHGGQRTRHSRSCGTRRCARRSRPTRPAKRACKNVVGRCVSYSVSPRPVSFADSLPHSMFFCVTSKRPHARRWRRPPRMCACPCSCCADGRCGGCALRLRDPTASPCRRSRTSAAGGTSSCRPAGATTSGRRSSSAAHAQAVRRSDAPLADLLSRPRPDPLPVPVPLAPVFRAARG